MVKRKEDLNGLQLCFLKLVSLTVFQRSFLFSVTFDIMLGGKFFFDTKQ